MLSQSATQAILDKFTRDVVAQSKANLTRKGNNGGKLYKSINGKGKANPKSIEAFFEMEDYGKFQDEGVQGVKSGARSPRSVFRFGSGTGKKGGLTTGILRWVTANRRQFKDKKTGQFMSYEQTAWLITRSIYNKGIKPTEFFSKPFKAAFERLPNDLVEAYGLDVETFLRYTIKTDGKES